MAMSTAPTPPAGVSLSADYVARQCRMCGTWSTSASEYPKSDDTSSWWPLVAWSGGTRASPRGSCCRTCINADAIDC